MVLITLFWTLQLTANYSVTHSWLLKWLFETGLPNEQLQPTPQVSLEEEPSQEVPSKLEQQTQNDDDNFPPLKDITFSGQTVGTEVEPNSLKLEKSTVLNSIYHICKFTCIVIEYIHNCTHLIDLDHSLLYRTIAYTHY